MKLQEWLHEKKWNTAIFSRESGISLNTLRKIVNGEGGINLDIALMIEISTGGKVKPWDLSQNAELIRRGKWPLRKTKPKDETKKTEKHTDDNHEAEIKNIG